MAKEVVTRVLVCGNGFALVNIRKRGLCLRLWRKDKKPKTINVSEDLAKLLLRGAIDGAEALVRTRQDWRLKEDAWLGPKTVRLHIRTEYGWMSPKCPTDLEQTIRLGWEFRSCIEDLGLDLNR